ncbi:small integral membrane protein 26-like [Odontesthes bonariensis]|uniref:small integral membrane protein 26-like n=1 Tax=Odontesthes bonariensis TaxID=219752 RepID=UPI003F58CC44
MGIKDFMKWNKSVSALYAVGIWTMICSFGYYKYTGRYEGIGVRKEEEEEPENPYKQVYKTPHSVTTIIYKKDFVPYTTRISNFIKSFSGEPGPEDGNK